MKRILVFANAFVSLVVYGMETMNSQNNIPSPATSYVKCETPHSCDDTVPQLSMKTPESNVSDYTYMESPSQQKFDSTINSDTDLDTFVKNYDLKNEEYLQQLIESNNKSLSPNHLNELLQFYYTKNGKLFQKIFGLEKKLNKKNIEYKNIFDGLKTRSLQCVDKILKKSDILQNDSRSHEPQTIVIPSENPSELLLFYIRERKRLANKIEVLEETICLRNKVIELFSVSQLLTQKSVDKRPQHETITKLTNPYSHSC